MHKIKRKIWKTFLGEDSWVRNNENFRTQELYGLINRANYAYGMLRAADVAKYFGREMVTVIEFGVAGGAGLLNMVEIAPLIEKETGIKLRIVGFDTGTGLPPVQGFKDHPELWRSGDFSIKDRDSLIRKLDGRAEIIWGDIRDTIQSFNEHIDDSAPIGFISVDVDIYTATKAALQCLKIQPEKCNPAVSMYFDDVSFFFANEWAGELAAIKEFNQENEFRKISADKSLVRRPRIAASWYPSMYICHVLDHERRQRPIQRPELNIDEHRDYMSARFLF